MGFPVPNPPQRSPAGISTSPPGYLFGDYPAPTPFRIHEILSDFDTYTAADWLVTTGGGTTALAAGNGGFIIQTTAASLNDIQANQSPSASFIGSAACRMWFAININLSDANLSQFQAGFANSFATMAPTNGIYFDKPSGATLLNLVLAKASVKTTIPITNLTSAQAVTVGFYYDGKPTPNLYGFCTAGLTLPVAFDAAHWPGGSQVYASASADGLNPFPMTNFPNTVAQVAGFGIKAGEGVAKTNTIDYWYAGGEIIRY